MNKFITPIYAFQFLAIGIANAQEPTSNTITEIMQVFTGSTGISNKPVNCGGFLDGAFQFGNIMENRFLDELVDINEEEEMEIGEVIFDGMIKNYKILTDHWVKKDAEEVLQQLVLNIDRKRISYNLHLLKDENINAFATLGGNIFLTTGLIDFVDSYDELAFIIAHEISHIDKMHTQRLCKKLLLAESVSGTLNMEDIAGLGLYINQMLTAPFGQPDEYEADSNGLLLVEEAGYDPERSLDFFNKMEKFQRSSMLSKFLSTHPFPSERKNCITTYLENH